MGEKYEIALPKEIVEKVNEIVDMGPYDSPEEFIRDSVIRAVENYGRDMGSLESYSAVSDLTGVTKGEATEKEKRLSNPF